MSALTADPLARAFWREQADLGELAKRDLRRWWLTLDTEDVRGALAAMEAFLPELIALYGEIGAVAAADFYDEQRDASGDVSRRFSSEFPDEIVKVDQVVASGRWAMSSLWGEASVAGALVNLEGVTKRLVLAPGRETIRRSVYTDPESAGWRRIGDGDSCKFCKMLIGRGEVYSKDTARFASHDDCGCMASPVWVKDFEPVTVEQFTATKNEPSAADKARVKEYLANMD